MSLGAGALPATTSLRPFRAVTRTLRDAATLTGAPVCGFRAMRALRSTRANFAKPESTTGSPLLIFAATTSSNPRTTASTLFASCPVFSASALTSSRRFMRLTSLFPAWDAWGSGISLVDSFRQNGDGQGCCGVLIPSRSRSASWRCFAASRKLNTLRSLWCAMPKWRIAVGAVRACGRRTQRSPFG